MTEPGSTDAAASARAAVARRRVVSTGNLLVLIATLAAALWGVWWLYDRLTNVYVLDARIASDMLLLSSQVSGWIVDVPVQESEQVQKGDVLVRIDDRLARGRVAELEAAVAVLDAEIHTTKARIDLVEARTRSHLDAARSRLEAAESGLAAAEGDLEVADSEWQRADALRQRNLVSQQAWEETRNAYRNAMETARQRRAEVAMARAAVAEAEADRAEVAVLRSQLDGLRKRQVQSQRSLEQARTELEYHTITSPVNGVIDELFVDPGEHVAASQRVLVMHDPSRVWVKANVKETDLRHVEVGDPVRILVDAYPGEPRRGVVRSVGDAATSQFALLPNPNPSGNFTKITQRVEVNIDLEEHDPRLKPGMMVEVKIPRS
ncbi:MAG TPA: HlyD family secretion protein [Pseudomonadales bacterium]